MEGILILAALCLLTPGAAGGIITSLANPVDSSVGATSEGVAAIGLGVYSSECPTLKSLLLAQENQLDESGNEPDLSKLKLVHKTQDSYDSYNLSTAAGEIPKSSWYNPNHGLVIYVHGFNSSPNDTNFKHINEAFQTQGQFNIIALDSSSYTRLLYLRSTRYAPLIGEAFGKFLLDMHNAGMPASSMYVVGHSLGAHISGFAGKTFTNLTGLKLSRISGLDPAGPCYDVESYWKLKKADAEFVDVMHTNAGVFGSNENIGHVDYWVNGGTAQPGCTLQFACSHLRANYLFAESVLYPDNFEAVACDSYSDFKTQKCNSSDISFMGFGSSNTTRGVYYLETAASSPYGLGENGTTYTG